MENLRKNLQIYGENCNSAIVTDKVFWDCLADMEQAKICNRLVNAAEFFSVIKIEQHGKNVAEKPDGLFRPAIFR